MKITLSIHWVTFFSTSIHNDDIGLTLLILGLFGVLGSLAAITIINRRTKKEILLIDHMSEST